MWEAQSEYVKEFLLVCLTVHSCQSVDNGRAVFALGSVCVAGEGMMQVCACYFHVNVS